LKIRLSQISIVGQDVWADARSYFRRSRPNDIVVKCN